MPKKKAVRKTKKKSAAPKKRRAAKPSARTKKRARPSRARGVRGASAVVVVKEVSVTEAIAPEESEFSPEYGGEQ